MISTVPHQAPPPGCGQHALDGGITATWKLAASTIAFPKLLPPNCAQLKLTAEPPLGLVFIVVLVKTCVFQDGRVETHTFQDRAVEGCAWHDRAVEGGAVQGGWVWSKQAPVNVVLSNWTKLMWAFWKLLPVRLAPCTHSHVDVAAGFERCITEAGLAGVRTGQVGTGKGSRVEHSVDQAGSLQIGLREVGRSVGALDDWHAWAGRPDGRAATLGLAGDAVELGAVEGDVR